MSLSRFDPGLIVIQAASIKPDPGLVESLIHNALQMLHDEIFTMHISAGEFMFGWNFFVLPVDRAVANRFELLDGMQTIRGDSLEQKFVNWLSKSAKAYGMDERVHFSLLSDLKPSRYGLF